MLKKITETTKVKITHPVYWGNWLILPGETATVPAELAEKWILTERAIKVAEAKNDNRKNSQ